MSTPNVAMIRSDRLSTAGEDNWNYGLQFLSLWGRPGGGQRGLARISSQELLEIRVVVERFQVVLFTPELRGIVRVP
jgi:hypothetical protein